jgi:glycine dehydrogenase subunit 1
MRYLPLSPDDRKAMLAKIGVGSVDALYVDVPGSASQAEVDLPHAASELAVERRFNQLAAQNMTAVTAPFFCGAGAYRHHVPASVDHLIQRSEFLTAYTPYQPEISQGTLQTVFEFQSQVAALTGMDVANASMYDGSTACAEAAAMAARVTKRGTIVISGGVHPHYAETVTVFCHAAGLKVLVADAAVDNEAGVLDLMTEDTACVITQSPNVFGTLTDLTPISAAVQAKGALMVVNVTEVISLGAVKSPGEMGADIVVAEGQSIGNGVNFGGPYVGLFATREKYIRQMPGRVAGETVDASGKRGFVLTLSTREQHIRRDKATSNICTNAGLCALAFTIHMTLLGEAGLKQLAAINHARAGQLMTALKAVPGVEVLTPRFFNEIAIQLPKSADDVVEALVGKGILGGVPYSRLADVAAFENVVLLAATEMNSDDDIAALVAALKEVLA